MAFLKELKAKFHVKTYHLDTGLFMRNNANKNLLAVRDMLSEMDCDDLSRKDITRLANFMCMPRKCFIDDYCIKC